MKNLKALRIVISPAYDAIVRDRSKRKSRIVSSLEKLTKRLERRPNTSIDDLKVIKSFAVVS